MTSIPPPAIVLTPKDVAEGIYERLMHGLILPQVRFSQEIDGHAHTVTHLDNFGSLSVSATSRGSYLAIKRSIGQKEMQVFADYYNQRTMTLGISRKQAFHLGSCFDESSFSAYVNYEEGTLSQYHFLNGHPRYEVSAVNTNSFSLNSAECLDSSKKLYLHTPPTSPTRSLTSVAEALNLLWERVLGFISKTKISQVAPEGIKTLLDANHDALRGTSRMDRWAQLSLFLTGGWALATAAKAMGRAWMMSSGSEQGDGVARETASA